MQQINMNNFLLLYKNSNKPYDLRNDFKSDKFLHPPKKEFIPDKLLCQNQKIWKSIGESNSSSQDENLMS
jgi:hypothetical protein